MLSWVAERPFVLDDYRISILICYEDLLPEFTRRRRARNPTSGKILAQIAQRAAPGAFEPFQT